MKNKLNRYFLLIVTTLAMLLSSCSDFSDSDSGSTGGKMSAVKIALNADSRTALPSAAEASEFKKFSLTYKKTEGGTEQSKSWTGNDDKNAYQEMIDDTIYVENGSEYTFTLKAFFNSTDTDSADGYYQGTVGKTIGKSGNTLSFTLALVLSENVGSGTGTGNLVLTVKDSDVENKVKRVTANVYKKGESSYELKSSLNKDETITENLADATLSWEDLPVGLYKVILEFFDEHAVKLGYNIQYATVVNGATSRNIEEIDAKNGKNEVYTIAYELGDSASFDETTTHPGTYSRFSSFTLPIPKKEGSLFCGWYNGENRITKIAAGSTGSLELTPTFISSAELPVLKTVTLTDSTGNSAQVGDTLTAGLKDDSESAFTGTVSYQWYRGETPIEGATSNEYKLTKDDLNAAISVKATQKYTVTPDSEITGLYSVSEGGRAPVTSSSVTVSKGTLNLTTLVLSGEAVKVTYNGGISVERNTTALESTELSPNTATVKDQAGNEIGVVLSFEENAKAPEASAYVNLVVTPASGDDKEGYNGTTKENAVFIKVKAESPATDSLDSLLRTDVANIAYGNIAFASASSTIEYTTSDDSSAEKPSSGAEWKNVTTAEFGKPEKLFVRTKASDGSEADDNGNKVGYVEESDSVAVSLEGRVGTLVKVNSVSFGDTALKFGNTVTVSPGYTVEGHIHNNDVDGTLSYQWYYGSDESWTAITGETENSYTIGTTSALNKKLKVIITQNHPNSNVYTAENVTSGTVEKGTLVPSGTLVYNGGNTVVVGAGLDASKLSGLTFTNQAGVSVTPELSFSENAKAPSETGDVTVKANLAGYNECSCTVVVKVRAAAPASIGTYLASGDALGSVSLGFIKFTQTTNVQYSTAETAPESDEGWTDATEAEFPAPAHLYLRIKAHSGTNGGAIASSVASSDFAADDGLASYKGKRCVVVDSVTVQTGNNDITVSCSEKTVTATVPAGVTVTNWEILNETLGELATVSEDKSSLSFKDNAEAGNYTVIVWATRGNNTLNATCLVKISSASGD